MEFGYGGAAHVAYPGNPETADEATWSRFLFVRPNPKGPFPERWCHSQGCRRWFNIVRDTVTHQITRSYRIGEAPDR